MGKYRFNYVYVITNISDRVYGTLTCCEDIQMLVYVIVFCLVYTLGSKCNDECKIEPFISVMASFPKCRCHPTL
jgi:hypothetical protein